MKGFFWPLEVTVALQEKKKPSRNKTKNQAKTTPTKSQNKNPKP